MINCAGTYHNIKIKNEYDKIPMQTFQYAIAGTYENFCKFCKEEFDHWLSCQNDDDGRLCEFMLDQHKQTYKDHDEDTWWLDIPDQKEDIIKFLQILCVQVVWDLGYLNIHLSDSEFRREFLPCWCPCHKRFKSYYDEMNNTFLSHNECLECTSSTKPFGLPKHSQLILTTQVTGFTNYSLFL